MAFIHSDSLSSTKAGSVCSMGGLSGNETHNHSLALQIKKCIYTLLSRETTSNQFRNIRRVEPGTDRGSPGFFTNLATVTLVPVNLISGSRMSLLAGLKSWEPMSLSTCGSGQVHIVFHILHTAQ